MMTKISQQLTVIGITAGLFASLSLFSVSTQADETKAKMIEQGKEIAFDRSKGNCIACHMIPGGQSPGTIGPPLLAMKARYPKKEVLREQIADPMKNNPETTMPPFGKHHILTQEQFDQVVEFIWSL